MPLLLRDDKAPFLIVAVEADQLIRLALRRAGINQPLISLADADSLELYLDGSGPFANRKKFPLPRIILQDVSLPSLAAFECPLWLKPPQSERSISITLLDGILDPWQFDSPIALASNAILCRARDADSLCAVFRVLRRTCLVSDAAPISFHP